MLYQQYAKDIVSITKKAGDIIMDYYHGKVEDLEIQVKEDHSPVTSADLAANQFIVNALADITPDIPIVTEEYSKKHNAKALGSDIFWIVDPLDGTKSYIKRTGDFTVNIAMVEGSHVAGGAIYVPTTNVSYYTAEDGKAYKQKGNDEPYVIHVRTPQESGTIVVASLSHSNQETLDYIDALDNVDRVISASSSLKFCMVAEGKADIYPRFGPTMEWDTAAGQAIVEAAGGRVVNINDTPFEYRKSEFKNPYFIVKSH